MSNREPGVIPPHTQGLNSIGGNVPPLALFGIPHAMGQIGNPFDVALTVTMLVPVYMQATTQTAQLFFNSVGTRHPAEIKLRQGIKLSGQGHGIGQRLVKN